MEYNVVGSEWYTPPAPGFDALTHVVYGAPNIVIVAVAIISHEESKSWKCYIGWHFYEESLSDSEYEKKIEQKIAASGAKVEKEVACAMFPSMDPERFVY